MSIDDPGVRVTYLQQYTPFTKAFMSEDLFKEHPFLITNLLSHDFVEKNPKFLQVYRAVDSLIDYMLFHPWIFGIRQF